MSSNGAVRQAWVMLATMAVLLLAVPFVGLAQEAPAPAAPPAEAAPGC